MYDKMNNFILEGIGDLNVAIYYYDEMDRTSNFTDVGHTHKVYELYLNLSDELSYVVNDRIYHLKAGDIMLLRPEQSHHSIYTSTSLRRRFVLFFSNSGAEKIFEEFLLKLGNHVVLPPEKIKRVISLCHSLLESEKDQFSAYYQTFELLHLLTYGIPSTPQYDRAVLPKDILTTISFISENLSKSITVRDMAQNAHVSINTLERHFKDILNVSPKDFLKHRRLAFACTLLAEGKSVQEACDLCGFPDYSHFIAIFKKEYGTTPLKYQKSKTQ